jgi:hypothetical protein
LHRVHSDQERLDQVIDIGAHDAQIPRAFRDANDAFIGEYTDDESPRRAHERLGSALGRLQPIDLDIGNLHVLTSVLDFGDMISLQGMSICEDGGARQHRWPYAHIPGYQTSIGDNYGVPPSVRPEPVEGP